MVNGKRNTIRVHRGVPLLASPCKNLGLTCDVRRGRLDSRKNTSTPGIRNFSGCCASVCLFLLCYLQCVNTLANVLTPNQQSIMYHWCCACLWQTLVIYCVNTCSHLNKPAFQSLSQILFVCGTLGCWSPLWNKIHQNSAPLHK